MVSIPRIVGVLSCGCLLGLSLSLNGLHTIKGEVLRIEPSSYFVKQYDGYEVRVHIDDSTHMTGRIGQGEHIEARVMDVPQSNFPTGRAVQPMPTVVPRPGAAGLLPPPRPPSLGTMPQVQERLPVLQRLPKLTPFQAY